MSAAALPVYDAVCVGAGVMSTTLATVLKTLDPGLSMLMIERLHEAGLESSDGWNNAGTGHAANCEMNYTPPTADGGVDISKALEVNVEFDLSRQLWAFLVRKGVVPEPARFILPCPHCAFVTGVENVAFLKARHAAMSAHHCFAGMEYSEDPAVIASWAPLVMAGRDPADPVACTRMVTGSDVDYGALTRLLAQALGAEGGFESWYDTEVHDVTRDADGLWSLRTRAHGEGGRGETVRARFVFVGAGGASLLLLEKSGIPEGKGYGGFPISGVWLRCDDPEVVAKHKVKVYSKAAHGSPPMSVPHLDMRVVDDRRSVLFGPYAGFSPKFLKEGSLLDLIASVRIGNIVPLLDVAAHGFKLEAYLADQVVLSEKGRFETLRTLYPDADEKDWKAAVAGQRVQVIRPDGRGGGALQFGTELVGSADGSFMALMGASPGASTAAWVASEVLKRCFAAKLTDDAWLPTLKEMIPTWGVDLTTDAVACRETRARTAPVLGLADV